MSDTTGTNDHDHDHDSTALDLIEEQAEASIRRIWHNGAWHFSIIDVVGLLTDTPKPRTYWAMMKERIQSEGFRQLLTKCERLKMRAADGKQRATDAADAKTLLRIIQSIPSPKAEPVKQWLARVGAKRLEDVTQPLEVSDTTRAVVTIPKPAESAPALAWADYYEQLMILYRRAAAYEARLEYVDAKLDEYDGQISGIHDRLEALEEDTRLIPEILERLGPQTLTPEHQATVKNMTRRLSELTGISYAAIYAELDDHFHVARYDQLPDAQWADITAWFGQRIDAAEKRRRR